MLIKKLNGNELGYRNGNPGGGGRFIYISKKYTQFLPPLSRTELNDSVLLPIVPPFSERAVYSAYVYHNSLFCTPDPKEDRNEFRIYLNKEIDPESSYYSPDDFIILQRLDHEKHPVFKLHHIPQEDENYEKLLDYLAEHTKQAFLITEECPIDLDDEYDSSASPLITEEIIDKINLDSVQETTPEPEIEAIDNEPEIDETKLIRSTSFRDLVMFFYEDKCAITRKSISYSGLSNLEAAHIKPDCHRGPMHPSNGVALSRDLHWAFDKGFFTLSDDLKVVVHEDLREDEILKTIHGKNLFVPADSRAKPNANFLQHHRENVYGLFKSSGNLRSL